MADPTQTPEALKRLCERLNTEMVWPQSAMGVDVLAITHPLCHEAAAAISALMAERDAMVGEAVKATKLHLAQITRAEQAEAGLREIAEIAAHGMPGHAVDTEAATELSSRLDRIATIARSTSQGVEG